MTNRSANSGASVGVIEGVSAAKSFVASACCVAACSGRVGVPEGAAVSAAATRVDSVCIYACNVPPVPERVGVSEGLTVDEQVRVGVEICVGVRSCVGEPGVELDAGVQAADVVSRQKSNMRCLILKFLQKIAWNFYLLYYRRFALGLGSRDTDIVLRRFELLVSAPPTTHPDLAYISVAAS
jgi:hypothetical protein